MGLLGSLKESAKARIARTVDSDAKADYEKRKRDEAYRKMKQRHSDVEYEKTYRADMRSGKSKTQLSGYLGSVLRQKRAERKERDEGEKAFPDRKKQRQFVENTRREEKAIERRQKFRKAERRISEYVEPISDAYDQIGRSRGSNSVMSEKDLRQLAGLDGLGGLGSDGAGKGRDGGMSERQLRELQGLDGFGASGKSKKGSGGGGGGGFSEAQIRELAGLSGNMFGGGGGGDRRSGHRKHSHKKGKEKTHRKRRQSAPQQSGWFGL